MTTYVPTIGLEIHTRLITKTKIFSAALNQFGDEPNTNVNPVCLGMPGVLPVINAEAIRKAIFAGLALNCSIASFTKWDRKHYFYPDLPKGYQISQYDFPICERGFLVIEKGDGAKKRIGITRAHLEEDAGKLIHSADGHSFVDLNRAGAPLLEIVSEPDMETSEEAVLYAKLVKTILTWIGVTSGNLQEGDIRFDINVSLRPEGQKAYGTKVEIKNLNSFRALQKAIEYELHRQETLLKDGRNVIQETRLWDAEKEESRSMRSKEDANDYRYFPDPDIPPFTPSPDFVEELRQLIPPLPETVKKELSTRYQLSQLDAGILTSDRALYDLFVATLQKIRQSVILRKKEETEQAKLVANWLSGIFLNLLRTTCKEVHESAITADILLELIELVEEGVVSSTVAKDIFEDVFESGSSPRELVVAKGLAQINDTSSLKIVVEDVIARHQHVVESIKRGKAGAIGFLVGQVMKESHGKANPQMVNEMIKKAITLDA